MQPLPFLPSVRALRIAFVIFSFSEPPPQEQLKTSVPNSFHALLMALAIRALLNALPLFLKILKGTMRDLGAIPAVPILL